jgi:hypothetical protein
MVPVHVRDPGEIVREVVPVPTNGITSEGTLESLTIVTEPFNCPVALGVKVVVKVHEAPGASAIPVVTQVPPEMLKLPVMEMLLMLMGAEIWLFNVMVVGALVVPTLWEANVTDAGVGTRGRMPVPLTVRVCGLPAASSATCSDPL